MESQTRSWIFIEWISTIILISGVALTSLNVYPINIYVNVIGNVLWLLIALHWNKMSLIIIQSFVLFLYVVGVVKVFVGV